MSPSVGWDKERLAWKLEAWLAWQWDAGEDTRLQQGQALVGSHS